LWPMRWLRWPAIILNCAMIATTPLGGAHYVTDLLGGAIVATLAVVVTRRICAEQPHARAIHNVSNYARINWSQFITVPRFRFGYSITTAPSCKHTEAIGSCSIAPRPITSINSQ